MISGQNLYFLLTFGRKVIPYYLVFTEGIGRLWCSILNLMNKTDKYIKKQPNKIPINISGFRLAHLYNFDIGLLFLFECLVLCRVFFDR